MSFGQSVRRDPRDRALNALSATYDGEGRCMALLEEWQSVTPLSPMDVGLASELTLGVARRRITCEHIASFYYKSRWASIRPEIRIVISLGIYQLCWLDRIPDHAAIDQTVKQTKRFGPGTVKIVNALLRRVQKERGEVVARESGDTPDRTTLLLDHERKVSFSSNIFPAHDRKPLQYLEAQYGIPPWLIERWHRHYKPQKCFQICESMIRRPSLTLRVNPLKSTAAELQKQLGDREVSTTISDDGRSLICAMGVSATEIIEINDGLCQPQDLTAQQALIAAELRPGMTVVDLCAGVGTKSIQAAELMNNEGLVIASDIDAKKLQKLPASCERHGITIIETVDADSLIVRMAKLDRPADVILVDAPCLNTGVLAKRPEAKFRASQKSLDGIEAAQLELLSEAMKAAGPKTRVVYSTCSIEREENEGVVTNVIARHPQWRCIAEAPMLPDSDRDGGFYAIFARD